MKVLAAVALVLVAFEVSLMQVVTSLSTDIEHINDFPEISQEMHDDTRPSILFLGNSLTGDGLDVIAFQEAWHRSGGGDIICRKVAPDATAICDWYYLFKTFFADPGQAPDVVVIGFAEGHMDDNQSPKAKQLGRHFCRLGHTGEIFEHDIHDFERRVEFLLSRASTTYGNQLGVKNRLLDPLIPYYREGTQTINSMLLQKKKAPAKDPVVTRQTTDDAKEPLISTRPSLPATTCHRLERLIAVLKCTNTRAFFVAMPRREYWQVQDKVYWTIQPAETINPDRTIDADKTTLIDMRNVAGLTAKHFADSMHLRYDGTRVYSWALARKLAWFLKEPRGGTISLETKSGASGTTTPER